MSTEPDARIEFLRRLGLSEPTLRLAAGQDLHPGLCECGRLPIEVGRPPFRLHARRIYYFCHEQLPGSCEPVLPPQVTWFVPMWCFRGGTTGVWENEGRFEFVDYSVDCPDDGFELISRTEQGLMAYILVGVLEEWLEEVAEELGFRFLDIFRTGYLRGEQYSEDRLAKVISQIDAKSSRLKGCS